MMGPKTKSTCVYTSRFLTIIIYFLFLTIHIDMARNVSVKQHSDTSAIISWSGLTNSGINSTLISSFIVTYNPTSMKDPCHNGLIASSIEVIMHYYL